MSDNELLPVGNIAWRVAVGSGVAAALACGLVALMVSRAGAMLLETTPAFTRLKLRDQKLLRVVCGFVAGMALGLSRTVWREAVVAEVWALSVLLFTALLGLFTCWMARPQRTRLLFGGFFIFGLLLTGNQEQIVLMPGLLFAVLLGHQALGRDLSLVIVFLALYRAVFRGDVRRSGRLDRIGSHGVWQFNREARSKLTAHPGRDTSFHAETLVAAMPCKPFFHPSSSEAWF